MVLFKGKTKSDCKFFLEAVEFGHHTNHRRLQKAGWAESEDAL
jgi:hypothetical protein